MSKNALFLSLLLCTHVAIASDPQYAILIDAGSSGSRLHLFEYQTDSKIPNINDLFSEKTSPGISSFENNPNDAGASLKKLLDDATSELQKRQIDAKQVSISLIGSAGMRSLPDTAQADIYTSITTYITQHYSFTPAEISTISGKLEGLYGWLDVNYLSHTFENSPNTTFGSLDMGGASTQITFATNDTTHLENEWQVVIGGNKYTVFSASFLGLGLDQALKAAQHHPLISTCYPANYPLSPTVSGAFNFSACENIFSDVMKPFSIASSLPNLSKQTFVAYSGFSYVYQFLGVDQTSDQAIVEARIQSVCNQSWATLKQDYATIPEKYLSNYCANATFVDDLLYNEYQLSGQQLNVLNSINGKDIDWTLGALLYQLIK